ncbi:hypothetical protein P7K49_004324 [Saguinus oedipus]|uniref:Uncharacterized protein n=1 Tax=Saguinus oedipus TaxID=9490 RepID=A0ABQ9W724_SAGOE|nr:hypothetical protein P7K49_004324 [Saguinus oedipus]
MWLVLRAKILHDTGLRFQQGAILLASSPPTARRYGRSAEGTLLLITRLLSFRFAHHMLLGLCVCYNNTFQNISCPHPCLCSPPPVTPVPANLPPRISLSWTFPWQHQQYVAIVPGSSPGHFRGSTDGVWPSCPAPHLDISVAALMVCGHRARLLTWTFPWQHWLRVAVMHGSSLR